MRRTVGCFLTAAMLVVGLSAIMTSTASANCVGCHAELTELPGEGTSTGGGVWLSYGNGSGVYCSSQRDYREGGIVRWIPEDCHERHLYPEGGSSGTSCNSAASVKGEIRAEPLQLTAGIISAKSWAVGLEWRPAEKANVFAAFECGATHVVLRGGVIGVATPINSTVTSEGHLTLAFNQNNGTQEVTKFEGGSNTGLEASINGAKFQKVALSATDLMTPAGTMELHVVGLPTPKGKVPGWGQCKAQAGGNYLDSNCTSKSKPKGKGSFEWFGGTGSIVNKSFTGTGSPAVLTATYGLCVTGEKVAERTPNCKGTQESLGPVSVECATENSVGEMTGSNEVTKASVDLKGCIALGSVPCSNNVGEEPGAAEEIQGNVLKGELGYINKATKEVGVDFTPAVKKGEFVKFSCAGFLAGVVGVGNLKSEGCAYTETSACGGDGIISPITPVNTMTNEYTQVYTANEADENIPNKLEGKSLQALESFLYNVEEPKNSTQWSKAGETLTNVDTLGEESELKA